MKKLISVFNTSIPFGRAINAMAHTALGMGHRIPNAKIPIIDVYHASNDIIREFKYAANKIYQSDLKNVLYADFISTMVGCSSTGDQLLKTNNTKENELDYFAVTICAEGSILSALNPILEKLTCLSSKATKNNYAELAEFDFITEPTYLQNDDPIYAQYEKYKISLVANKTSDMPETTSSMLIACLDVGGKADLVSLHLLVYIDADDCKHANISYHSFPILTARNQGRLEMLALEVKNDNRIISSVRSGEDNRVLSVCLFGEAEIINSYTKSCSLWNKELNIDQTNSMIGVA